MLASSNAEELGRNLFIPMAMLVGICILAIKAYRGRRRRKAEIAELTKKYGYLLRKKS